MKIKAGNDERVWLFFRNIILIGGLLLILCPLWMVLINSFKTLEEAGKNFFALPSKLNLENYIELFTNSNYWIFLKNSFKITVISIILILIFVPSVSYSIARNFNRKYYKTIYFYIMMGLFVPSQVVLLPVTKMMSKLNMLNHAGLIILYAAFGLTQGGLPDGKIPEGGLYGDSGCVNGPHVHEYLQEMNREVLSKYDLMTVGECAGVTIEEAEKYASADGKELSMVFQFELVDLASGTYGKWTDKRVPLKDFKRVMTAWQTELEGKAWNSLFLGNHDQPRCLSRFGDDSPEYRVVSAKMLATCLHMMQGTPYVYQGDELGMKNVPFHDLSEFRDIESINAFHELTGAGKVAPDDMMRYLNLRGRDNARTPMQWDDTASAGFTTGTPWIKVGPDYETVNAKNEMADPDSVYNYYKKLIHLRKEKDIMVYGTYELLDPEDEALYVYTRTLGDQKLLVMCNFTKEEQEYTVPETFAGAEVLISNYPQDGAAAGVRKLRAYEAVVLETK